MKYLRLSFLLACAVAPLTPALAQQPRVATTAPALLTLRGITFDSLSGRPLAAATVRIVGRIATQLSDSNGQFRFDSVAAGEYMLVMEHPRLDSIGLPEIAMRTTVSENKRDVRLVIPAFATLWRGACGSRMAPADSGLIYGVVRDADNRNGLANTRVLVSWIDIGLKDNKLQSKRFTLETQSDSTGSFIACGIPADIALAVATYSPLTESNKKDTTITATFDLPAPTSRIQRRDLLVATNSTGIPTRKGSVRGRVTDESGAPFADVRVLIDGVEVTRTDSVGSYSYSDARVGTHTIEFSAFERPPITHVIDVTPGNTVLIGARVERFSAASVRSQLKASSAERLRESISEGSKKRGGGLDSTQLKKYTSMTAVIQSMGAATAASVPNGVVRISTGGRRGMHRTCDAEVFIDNTVKRYADFWALSVSSIAWIGVDEKSWNDRDDPYGMSECGSITVITKWAIAK